MKLNESDETVGNVPEKKSTALERVKWTYFRSPLISVISIALMLMLFVVGIIPGILTNPRR